MKNLLLFLNVLACASSFFAADGSSGRSGAASGGGVEHSVVARESTKLNRLRAVILLNTYEGGGSAAIEAKIQSKEWDKDNTFRLLPSRGLKNFNYL